MIVTLLQFVQILLVPSYARARLSFLETAHSALLCAAMASGVALKSATMATQSTATDVKIARCCKDGIVH